MLGFMLLTPLSYAMREDKEEKAPKDLDAYMNPTLMQDEAGKFISNCLTCKRVISLGNIKKFALSKARYHLRDIHFFCLNKSCSLFKELIPHADQEEARLCFKLVKANRKSRDQRNIFTSICYICKVSFEGSRKNKAIK